MIYVFGSVTGSMPSRSFVGQGFPQLIRQPGIAQLEIDKTWPGDLGLLAQVVDLHQLDQSLGYFARRLAELLPERHGAICLVVAEFGVLAGTDHVDQFREFVDRNQRSECRGEAFLQQSQYIHDEKPGIGSTAGRANL
jgi:hypothetical protein